MIVLTLALVRPAPAEPLDTDAPAAVPAAAPVDEAPPTAAPVDTPEPVVQEEEVAAEGEVAPPPPAAEDTGTLVPTEAPEPTSPPEPTQARPPVAPSPAAPSVPVFAPTSEADHNGAHPSNHQDPPVSLVDTDEDLESASPSQPGSLPDMSSQIESFTDLVPIIRARGVGTAFGLALGAGFFAFIAALLQRLSLSLRPSGVFPATLRTIELMARTLVAAFGLAVVGALVPDSLAPALPLVVLAGAIAIGWSARDVARDLIAGLFLAVEGQLKAGDWVRGERYAGTVETLGLRVTWLRDVHGRRIIVPNRILLANPLITDTNPWPRIQFTVSMPDLPGPRVRGALVEAIALSPWVAPTPEVEVHPDGVNTGHWHVAVRLLDSGYADRFQGLLRERVEEILET